MVMTYIILFLCSFTCHIIWNDVKFTLLFQHFTGSPKCPTVSATVYNSTSLTVSIQKSTMMWLPQKCSVEVISYNESIPTIGYNSTLKGCTSFNVTSLQPGTVYIISVIPCNMVGCNTSCDMHSVQTIQSETGNKRWTYVYNNTQNCIHPTLCYCDGG